MLNTAYEADDRPRHPIPQASPVHNDTCLFFGCEDLDTAYQHLRAHGLNVKEPKIAPYGMKQLWFTDPDGYGFCFQWPATQKTHDQWVEAYGMSRKLFLVLDVMSQDRCNDREPKQTRLHLWPLRRDDRVAYRIAGDKIRSHPVSAKDPFKLAADAFERGARTLFRASV